MSVKSKKDELRSVLKRLNEGEYPAKIKEEAKELLANIDPKDLSMAEQELIEEGLPETELRHLCAAHIEAMAEELESLKMKIGKDHPLYSFIKEHDKILEILNNLEKANNIIQGLNNYNSENNIFEKLKLIGENLLETEKHHEREEKALFPEVDKTGVTGPTRIMKMEHEDLWPIKERIKYLGDHVKEMNFNKFKEELNEKSQYLILTLRDHIYKENNILYPTAQQVIPDSFWQKIKDKCDEIGYCNFQ